MKIVRHVSRAARYALFAALVGSALALSVLRFWLLPEVSRFRGQLQARAGELLGETVRIGTLSARMQGLEPQLVLRDLAVIPKDPGVHGLSIRKVRLGVSLLQSVLQRAPVLASLRVEGARVALEQGADGKVGIAGLSSGGGVPLWLFSLNHLVLTDINLEWHDPEGPAALPLGRLNLRWSNRETRHRLSALLQLTPDLGTRVALAANLTGEGTNPLAWQGDVYLEGTDLRLGGPVSRLLPKAVIRAGMGGLKAWGRWQAGVLASARGTVALGHPLFALGGPDGSEAQVALDALNSHFAWERGDGGWRVALGRLQLAYGGERNPPADVALVLEADANGARTLRAAASDLRLEDLHLFQNALPPGTLRDALQAMAPRGLVQQPKLVLGLDGGDTWGFCGGFRDVAFQAWNGIPGLGPVRGRVCGSNRCGRGAFLQGAGHVQAARLWQHPVSVQGVEAVLEWERGSEGLLISVPTLRLQAPGLKGQARLTVRLPDVGASPFVDLQARLADVDARLLHEYLPLAALPDSTARWLRSAFVAGRIESAEVLLYGPLADFPFRAGEGVFQARAEVENAELTFHPDWPPVQGFSGRVDFQRAGMDVTARAAGIGGMPIRGGQAHAGDFDRDPWLLISGSFDTGVREALDFLSTTPLRQIPERVFKYSRPQGEAGIDLKLKVYLPSDHDEVKVDGNASLGNARLNFPALGVGIRDLTGVLRFSENGLWADDLKGSVLGRRVQLRVGQEGDAIRTELRGETPVETLQTLVPESGMLDFLQGSLAYRLVAAIPQALTPAGDPLRMTLTSDLAGLAVLLPAPLGKPAGAKRELRVELAFPAGEDMPLRAVYGADGLAQLWFAESAGRYSFSGGDIHMGRVGDKASREPGLRLRARVGELDGSAWKEFLARMKEHGPPAGLLNSLTLQADSLLWEGKHLGPLSLELTRHGGDWKGRIDNALGQGDLLLKVPEYGHPLLKLELKRLGLPDMDGVGSSRPAPVGPAADAMPVIQLHADRTLWRGTDLGTLDLATERWTQGLNIKDLTLTHRNHTLQLKGGWLQSGAMGETRLEGKLDVRDLGIFLAGLGYAKEIRDTPAQAQFSLDWPRAPHQMTAARVRGGIDLTLGRGSVLSMEPGLGRALAVLNLDSLKRLLLLDFSDMFGKGLSYDSMRGRFELGGGQARTSGFVIDAVAGTILISGRVGLVAKDLDETVTVIPHTLASLPIGGVMVGGAAVGAALSMAGKLVGQDSVSIASNRYAIKGSWDDPQVSRIEGNMPLDVLNRAWSGLKNFSGFGSTGEEGGNE